jgi:hypothetical protein
MAKASVALCLALVLPVPPASAQCRTACARGESRDPYGCCIPVRRRSRGVLPPIRAERLVGFERSPVEPNIADELAQSARAFLTRANELNRENRTVAIQFFTSAAGAALVFLSLSPNDPRNGRMRAVLVAGLDGAGMRVTADREAAALGGPRPVPEPSASRTLRGTTMLELARAHTTMGSRVDAVDVEAHRRAIGRYHRAAEYYRAYVAQFDDTSEAPGARSQLANVLLYAGDYLEAAAVLEELARVPSYPRADALRRAMECYQNALSRDGIALRTDAPSPSEPRPPMPDVMRRLMAARERYLEATANDRDHRDIWRAQQVEHVLWLFRYAEWQSARPRLVRLLRERCDDGAASDAAYLLMRMESPERQDRTMNACEVLRHACEGARARPECASP